MKVATMIHHYDNGKLCSGRYDDAVHAEEGKAERNAYIAADEAGKAAVAGRIESLYHYLLDLTPQEASEVVVSEASFRDHPTATILSPNTDGSYDITVTATVDVTVTDGPGSLTLTAYIDGGQYYDQTDLSNGTGTYALTIRNVPASLKNETVTLAIDGTQTTCGDVFLLDAEGIRGASQSMIGTVSGTLPVHAQVNVEPDRTFTIHKYEEGQGDLSERLPLSDISFEIYWVGSIDDYLNGKLAVSSVPTDEEIKTYAVSRNLVATITTDQSGTATYCFGTGHDGLYLVKEMPNEAIAKTARPFYISIPTYDETGHVKDNYTVTAYPKNGVTSEEVEIGKDVTSLNNDSDSFAVGQEHSWIISTTIPQNLASGKSYVISDTLDYRLDYQALTSVTVENADGSQVRATLTADTDYVLHTDTAQDANGHTVDCFTVSLTAAGMKKAADAAGEDFKDCFLRVRFTAVINQNADMGEIIPNEADVDYTNRVGKSFHADSDRPEVHTGAATLRKVDAGAPDTTLSGAVFTVYRPAAEDETEGVVTMQVDGQSLRLVQVDFYDNPELEGEKVWSLTTGADGMGYFYGLAYGTYYLVETKAPAGYNKLSQPQPFTVDASSHTETMTLTITNSTGVELPSTGGMGTWAFTAGGLSLLCAAAALLLWKRRQANA